MYYSKNFLIIDFETTGLTAGYHEIHELGCVLVDCKTFDILDTREFKCGITNPITVSQEALNLNGTTKEELLNRTETLEQLIQNLHSTFFPFGNKYDNPRIAAWNANFDLGFLKQAYIDTNMKSMFENELDYHIYEMWTAYDTYRLGNELLKETPLGGCVQALREIGRSDLADNYKHRGLSDALSEYEILKCIMKDEMHLLNRS